MPASRWRARHGRAHEWAQCVSFLQTGVDRSTQRGTNGGEVGMVLENAGSREEAHPGQEWQWGGLLLPVQMWGLPCPYVPWGVMKCMSMRSALPKCAGCRYGKMFF